MTSRPAANPVAQPATIAHELTSRLRDADKQGATTIVITSAEIGNAIPRAGQGDIVLIEQDTGSGMTVRYRLPRPTR
jgi:hypothetical protein